MKKEQTYIENTIVNETNSLSLQIDAKTMFQLEFATRVTGLPITSFIERAIKDAVGEIKLTKIIETEECLEENSSSEISLIKDWSSYWDTQESVRMVSMLTCDLMKEYTSSKDDQISSFILKHWNYFGTDEKLEGMSRPHCNLIWPHINYLVKKWLGNRLLDPECGTKMLDNVLDGTDLVPFT